MSQNNNTRTYITHSLHKKSSCHIIHILGYPDLYLMKLVDSHVITVDGVGDVLESGMMYNQRVESVPYGPCPQCFVCLL